MAELEYEPSAEGRPVHVEHAAGVTRVVLPMRGPFAPVPQVAFQLDVFSFVVVPVWWVASLVIHWIRRTPKPPRAVFEISESVVKVTVRELTQNEVQEYEWPRSAVVAMRANRYEDGLWVDVPGHFKNTLLTDLPKATIAKLEEELQKALSDSR